jgi:hypothetical protein
MPAFSPPSLLLPFLSFLFFYLTREGEKGKNARRHRPELDKILNRDTECFVAQGKDGRRAFFQGIVRMMRLHGAQQYVRVHQNGDLKAALAVD